MAVSGQWSAVMYPGSPVYPHQAAGAAPALALHLGEPPSDGLGNIIAIECQLNKILMVISYHS